MNLADLHKQITVLLNTVDFSVLWRGFAPCKFALYTDTECYFDGAYIEKPAAFVANTSTEFQGEMIAIWKVDNVIDMTVFASKLAHEMFHAYQKTMGETRYPDEMEALQSYSILPGNLSEKHRENQLLSALHTEFSPKVFLQFLAIRCRRQQLYPYEYAYEAAVEQIEGTANYVELEVLKQLDEVKYQEKLAAMLTAVTNPENLLPVRVISYDIGALVFLLLGQHRLADFETFSGVPATVSMLEGIEPFTEPFTVLPEVSAAVTNYQNRTGEIITAALEKAEVLVTGENLRLISANIYDARRKDAYIVSTSFVLYECRGERIPLTGDGDFVIEMGEGWQIKNIYRG